MLCELRSGYLSPLTTLLPIIEGGTPLINNFITHKSYIMFVAKFNQANSAKFKADKNGNYPFVGTVLAGTAQSTIINGTLGMQEGIESGASYLCENTPNEEYPQYPNTVIVGKVDMLQYAQLRTALGAPRLQQPVVDTETGEVVEAKAETAPFEG